MTKGVSVADLLDNPAVSWLLLDGWHGRIAVPIVVVEERGERSDVRLLSAIGMRGVRVSAGTIKKGVPNYSILKSFVGSIPPKLIPAEIAP